jgi:hypothetical protein
MVGGCPKGKYGSVESQKALKMIETSTSDQTDNPIGNNVSAITSLK